jgi:EmrB/QacA subfamily drug resistance transporter
MPVLAKGTAAPSDPESGDERRWIILGALCLTILLAVAANLALNVALPTLGRQLHAGITSLQWIVDIYVLCFAGLLLPAGALGDRIGRKAALELGLAIFAVSCLAGAFSTETWELIVARGASGVGAALAMPGTLSIVTAVFPPRERATAVAIWASVAGASVVVAITWSGLMLDHFWWGSIFIGMGVLALVAALAALILVPESRSTARAPVDLGGVVFSVFGVGGVVFGLIEAPADGWGSLQVLVAFALGAVGIVAFVTWELRLAHPMVPLRLFADRRAWLGALSIAAAYFALFGMYFVTTQYLQVVRGCSPVIAGLYALPAGVAQLILANTSRSMVARFGHRCVLGLGLLAGAAGLAVLALSGTSTGMWRFEVGLALLGIGIGYTMPPSTTVVLAALPPDQAGVGSAVNNVVREIGGAFGIGLLGSVTLLRYRDHLASALHGLPASAVGAARSGVAQAVAVGQDQHPSLVAAARDSYAEGMRTAMWAGAAVVLVVAAVVAGRMPARSGMAREAQAPASSSAGPAR